MYPRILAKMRALVKQGDYILSIHAENELADDNLTERDIEAAILNGDIVSRERETASVAQSISSREQPWRGKA